MKAVILISCEGYQENEFHFCNKVENIVLDLETIQNTENYFNLIQYLDKVVKIFEGPCNTSHIISSAMYKLYEFGYIDDKKHHHLAYFYNMHKRCGLLLKILLKENS